jgi:hypothetical protein
MGVNVTDRSFAKGDFNARNLRPAALPPLELARVLSVGIGGSNRSSEFKDRDIFMISLWILPCPRAWNLNSWPPLHPRTIRTPFIA